MSIQEATEKWNRAEATYPPQHRRGSGEGLRLAFMDIPRTDGVASRGVKRQLEQEGIVDNQQDFEDSARMISIGQIGRSLTDSEFAEVGGGAFRSNPALLQEGHHDAASEQSAMLQPRAASATQMQLTDLDRHPVSGQSSDAPEGRALRAVASDPTNPLTRIECSALVLYYVCCLLFCFV